MSGISALSSSQNNNSFKASGVSIQRSTSAKSSFEGKGSPELNLINLTYSNKFDKIDEYLKKNPSTDIMVMKDIRLYSLLHIACLNSHVNICKKFIEHVKAQNVSDGDFLQWINGRTDEGYTPIHFASFKGSLELIKLLEGYGADIQAKNYEGLNVMHIGAQGDQPISLAYFMRKGFNIQEVDNKGSTPLHWAAFLGMENATTYLTSWGSNPNLKDIESGFTPLHLAVVSGNARVVRRLLIKGADRHIRDNENKLPKDLAIENEYGHIVQLLEGRGWLVECFNIKPGFQRRRTKHSLVLFISLTLISIISNFVFIFPYVSEGIWVILNIIFTCFTIGFFLLSWLTNPGYMQNKKCDVLSLLMKYDAHKICPECVILKPARSKHCDYCGACVAVFDHHCPWVDNCVGAKNHKYFLMFILSTLISSVFITIMALVHVGKKDPVYEYYILKFESNTTLFAIKEVVCSGDFILAIIFVVPLALLNYVQVCNFIKGKTTNERYGYQGNKESVRPKPEDISSTADAEYIKMPEEPKKEKKNNRSFLMNCKAMCFTNAQNYEQNHINSQNQLGIN